MKLSTKGRYAIRALLDSALTDTDSAVPIKDIAKRQQIPEAYLRQLSASLRTAGIISVTRGAFGGWKLTRPLSQIKIRDVVVAMDGSLAMVECVDDPGMCPRSGHCPMRTFWVQMTETIGNFLDSKTLQDLVP
ncbi:MAG: Rrf2 family transcriptional regulator [Dehalococcoidia bacterium]|nr:Rrf2 family transcriptional regulator [Dehalococcoidia bacterium]